ncbi:MAG: ABC transporter ATP-binding protein, partial [Ramlibacter sp.]|nr:ABC transporter ATP-binding protein [Ramlibacter sp.]
MQQNDGRGRRAGLRNLGRALRFLFHHRRIALIATVSLFLSIGAQLAVPQMVQNILDAVANGLMLQQTGNADAAAQAAVVQAMLWSFALILAFAVARGAFAFTQAFMAETLSQNVAFDFRNELFAKIQRLSFSYHDRNRTGQLMVRATDDVEKLRLFLGQGLLLALQAFVLLTGALVMLLLTNVRLTMVVLPILPIALVLFMIFGAVTQPLFGKIQAKLSAMNTVLQESVAGIRVI